MMSHCLVRGCRNAAGRTDVSVSFHPFPAKREAAERWASLCRVSSQDRSQLLKDLDHGGAERYHLCSLHFEQEAFEIKPDDKTCSKKLKQGAEPTLLLSPRPTPQSSAQVDSSLPAARSPHGQAPPSASSPCTCARTSRAAQGPDGEKPSSIQLSESRPQVSHCATGATVVRSQPGVSQIVLNFREEGKSLTLDNVSTESAPQCRGGCHCPQRGVKQVVVIFLDPPRDSATPPSSAASPPTVSSGTQTEARDGKSETNAQVRSESSVHPPSHQEVVHASTQTSTCTEASGPQQNREVQDSPKPEDRSPKTSEVRGSPGEKICPSTALSASILCEPDQQNDATRREADCMPLASSKLPAAPKSLDKEPEHSCGVPTPIEDTRDQQLDDDQTPRNGRKFEPENRSHPPLCPHNQQNAGHFCSDPSINQYVGDLLEQYNVPPPSCIPAPVFSSRCISAQRRVKQIVLNFVEQESASVNQESPAPSTSSNLPSPGVTSLQNQETQTCDDLPQQTPQRANQNPQSWQSTPVRPPRSRSCPPALNIRTLRQEEESSPDHPLPQDTSLEDKVTFEDVAVYFSKEEWELLGDEEKDLYREVMADNYRSLRAVGLLQETPDLVIRMENEEEDLWVDQGSLRRIHHQEEERWCLDRDMDGVRLSAEESDASPCAGRESAESSSHLGALMRLVKEIPGFLLGSSVTDGSSPARSIEDHGNGRQILEVKIEEPSPVSSPASAYVPVSEAVEIAASPGVHRSTEQNNSKIVTKAEKTEVAVSPSSRYSTPVSHPPISSFCMKSDPGTDRLQIKQEEFPAACSPAQQKDIPLVKPNISHLPKIPLYSPGTWDHLIPDHAKRPSSGGGTSLSRSTAASPRNPSVSPASPHQRTKATGLGELKIKQEDSGSERDLSDSPVYGRKVYQTPASSSMVLPAEREPWRMAASPLRSPADAPLGSSPLHRLANCLREITTSRPRPFSGPLSATRWVTDMSRVCAEASGRASASSTMAATQPNPFTAAVTNGAAQLRGVEPKTSDPRASREDAPVSPMRHVPLSPMRHVPLSALGKCLEKIQSRGVTHSSEEPRRAEPGVKRTHSEDLCSRPGAFGGAKRPALEVSSRVVSSCSPGHRDLWRPPEELPRAPTEDQPIGSSHLLSVMNCVRRIPGCRPASSIHVAPDLGRPCTQGVTAEVKDVKVKQERDENPPVETSRQWIAPPQSPDVPKQSGPVASNVHLTGLMRLMEEIPCVESINPSRAMYSIAVGHSMARRMDRSNYLSSCNDDSSFPAELNDGTVASGDSVYSDDTSWSSENVDPSYSAIGGLQRVVSEFAELGSVSPLVAVAAPPGVQDGSGLKKPKEALTASRLNESVRRSPREAAGVAASACSAENGEATIAAIRGLQKVVHGFVEQECVSPITAVRNSTPNSGQRDLPGRKTSQEEEAVSPHILGSPPAPIPSHFLCDSGKWLSERDSSYSALSGLQKVVNGFSEMSCVSPFSAVSTPVSEGVPEVSIQRRRDAQEQDVVSSTPSGQKNVINGVPEAACLSPMTVASNVSSESDAGLTMKSRRERSDEGETSQKCPTERQRSSAIAVPSRNDSRSSSSSHCIDLTQEEEPVGSKNKTAAPDKDRKPKTREGRPLGRPTELPSTQPVHPVGNRPRLPGSSRIPSNQLIDLTEEEETLTKPKALSSEMARKPSHTGVALNPPLAEKHRWSINSPKNPSARLDKPLDPGASGSSRAGSDVRAVPAVNEHLSGLEKLLKGVPTFTPAPRGSGQAWSGSWWFKSTSSHET